MRLVMFLLSLSVLGQANALAQEAAPDSKIELIQQFLAAFNAQNSKKMGELVTPDVKWLSVANGVAATDVEGRPTLVKAMDDYFVSCPSCRSIISDMMPSRDRVSAIEVATWQTRDGPKSQQSLAIYEFSNSLISAVYYFPAELVDTSDNEFPTS
ncbi:MAG: nuclear transport factor 2 family protein [Pseudomonadota bacterium]